MSDKTRYPSQKLDQYMLRLPDGMRDRLKEEALKNQRTLNQEIVSRLQFSLERASTPSRLTDEMAAALKVLLDGYQAIQLEQYELELEMIDEALKQGGDGPESENQTP